MLHVNNVNKLHHATWIHNPRATPRTHKWARHLKILKTTLLNITNTPSLATNVIRFPLWCNMRQPLLRKVTQQFRTTNFVTKSMAQWTFACCNMTTSKWQYFSMLRICTSHSFNTNATFILFVFEPTLLAIIIEDLVSWKAALAIRYNWFIFAMKHRLHFASDGGRRFDVLVRIVIE